MEQAAYDYMHGTWHYVLQDVREAFFDLRHRGYDVGTKMVSLCGVMLHYKGQYVLVKSYPPPHVTNACLDCRIAAKERYLCGTR